MGCCQAHRPEPPVIEQTYYSLALRSLDLQDISSTLIDNTFHRFSYSTFTTRDQIILAYHSLGLPRPNFSAVYNHFQVSDTNSSSIKYSSTKFCTFGILLGAGDDLLKLKLLFHNYDKETQNLLKTKEIKQMVNEIIEIELFVLAFLAAKMFPNDGNLAKEVSKMNKVKEILIGLYVKIASPTEKDVRIEEFLERMKCEEGKKLVRILEIQQFALKYAKEVEKRFGEISLWTKNLDRERYNNGKRDSRVLSRNTTNTSESEDINNKY
jgi:hypothetical protein